MLYADAAQLGLDSVRVYFSLVQYYFNFIDHINFAFEQKKRTTNTDMNEKLADISQRAITRAEELEGIDRKNVFDTLSLLENLPPVPETIPSSPTTSIHNTSSNITPSPNFGKWILKPHGLDISYKYQVKTNKAIG